MTVISPRPDRPLLLPLGDEGLLVRFGDSLSEAANIAAIRFAQRAVDAAWTGVTEIVPNLVSVLLRYDPARIGYEALAGEVRLLLSAPADDAGVAGRHWRVPVVFDGEDLAEVARLLALSVDAFMAAHDRATLRVLATGFAPGFLYCGFHDPSLRVPRRQVVRRQVPAGTILFAAGQTAITSTPIPTGWHVLGHTDFRNFDAGRSPPVEVQAGDTIRFEAVS